MLKALDLYGDTMFDWPDELVVVWSDLHIGHENAIPFNDRPFADVHEMNAALWGAWQAALTPDTVMVVVGDTAMRKAVSRATWARIQYTPGYKYLVIGNHDLLGCGELRTDGFDEAWSLMLSPGDPPLIWTHYPLGEVPEGYVNIHGHMHNRSKPTETPHINVSVEQLDYTPIEMTRLRKLAKALIREEYPPGETTLGRVNALG